MEVDREHPLRSAEFVAANPRRICVIKSRYRDDWIVYQGFRQVCRRPTQLAAFREAEREARK